MVWQFPNDEIIYCDRCDQNKDGDLWVPSDIYGLMTEKEDFDDGCHYVCWDCLTDEEYKSYEKLSDYDRGDADCQLGKPHMPGQSKEYDHAYGARYAKEQMDNAKFDPLNKFNERLLGL